MVVRNRGFLQQAGDFHFGAGDRGAPFSAFTKIGFYQNRHASLTHDCGAGD
jgi:hypothetical protein